MEQLKDVVCKWPYIPLLMGGNDWQTWWVPEPAHTSEKFNRMADCMSDNFAELPDPDTFKAYLEAATQVDTSTLLDQVKNPKNNTCGCVSVAIKHFRGWKDGTYGTYCDLIESLRDKNAKCSHYLENDVFKPRYTIEFGERVNKAIDMIADFMEHRDSTDVLFVALEYMQDGEKKIYFTTHSSRYLLAEHHKLKLLAYAFNGSPIDAYTERHGENAEIERFIEEVI